MVAQTKTGRLPCAGRGEMRPPVAPWAPRVLTWHRTRSKVLQQLPEAHPYSPTTLKTTVGINIYVNLSNKSGAELWAGLTGHLTHLPFE